MGVLVQGQPGEVTKIGGPIPLIKKNKIKTTKINGDIPSIE